MFKFIKKIKESKLNRQKAIELALDVVEDRLSVIDFWNIYLSSEDILNEFRKTQKKSKHMDYLYGFVREKERLERIDMNHLGIRATVCSLCRQFLVTHKVTFTLSNSEVKQWNLYGSMCPKWLQVDIDFLESIIKTAPPNTNDKLLAQFVRHKIKEIFKTRSGKYPHWLQNPEWPIIDGRPLKFIRQDGDINNYEDVIIKYYFYDELSKEEHIVEQFD